MSGVLERVGILGVRSWWGGGQIRVWSVGTGVWGERRKIFLLSCDLEHQSCYLLVFGLHSWSLVFMCWSLLFLIGCCSLLIGP